MDDLLSDWKRHALQLSNSPTPQQWPVACQSVCSFLSHAVRNSRQVEIPSGRDFFRGRPLSSLRRYFPRKPRRPFLGQEVFVIEVGLPYGGIFTPEILGVLEASKPSTVSF
eukprot:GHVT01020218.1.p1 GENE.GHVT01020218.1~~GHVT01020218.1.p1  ORF type:complete len:111 (+),score=5.46 GHVT01020218.1:669-1001(+)